MAIGRRCSMGCETWPDDEVYRVCPECGQDTKRYRGVTVSIEEPQASHRRFEAFYNEWDERMPDERLKMAPEENLKWDSLYPDARPRPLDLPSD